MIVQRQSGVALAIVVWFLAAMSLLVAGIVFQAKVDTRIAQTHIARAQAEAAGDGAISLMLAALKTNQIKGYQGRGVPQLDFLLGEQTARVFLIPESGLIDLNGAPRELLATLFANRGAALEGDALALADSVVWWRKQVSRRSGQTNRFSAIEDLLRVPGASRTLLEVVRDSLVVGTEAHVGVDWMSAPQSVLDVLSGGDDVMVSEFLAARAGGFETNKTMPRGVNQRFQSVSPGNNFRVDAYVEVGDKLWLRRRWVSLDSGGNRSLLPWRYTRTEPIRAVN